MGIVVVVVGHAMLMVSSGSGRDCRILSLRQARVVIVVLEMDLCLQVPGFGVLILSFLDAPPYLTAIAIVPRLDLRNR